MIGAPPVAARAAEAHALGERGLGGQQIEGVGIDDQGRVVQGERARQARGRCGGGPEPGADGDGLHRREVKVFRMTQHQFGMLRIPGGCIVRDEAHIDTSRARHQSGTRAKQRRTDHAFMAAQHRQRSIASLVRCMMTLRQMRTERGRRARRDGLAVGASGPHRGQHLVRSQGGNEHVPGNVAPHPGEQPGAGAQHCHRNVGVYDRSVDDAGGRRQSAGNVDGEHRCALCVGLDDVRNERRGGAVERARQADAEEAVDNPGVARGGLRPEGRGRLDGYAGGEGVGVRPAGVVG